MSDLEGKEENGRERCHHLSAAMAVAGGTDDPVHETVGGFCNLAFDHLGAPVMVYQVAGSPDVLRLAVGRGRW